MVDPATAKASTKGQAIVTLKHVHGELEGGKPCKRFELQRALDKSQRKETKERKDLPDLSAFRQDL